MAAPHLGRPLVQDLRGMEAVWKAMATDQSSGSSNAGQVAHTFMARPAGLRYGSSCIELIRCDHQVPSFVLLPIGNSMWFARMWVSPCRANTTGPFSSCSQPSLTFNYIDAEGWDVDDSNLSLASRHTTMPRSREQPDRETPNFIEHQYCHHLHLPSSSMYCIRLSLPR